MYSINRTFIASMAHSAAILALFVFSLSNAQAQPVFQNIGSDVTITCGQDLPSSEGVQASSDCEGPVSVDLFVSETGQITDNCTVSTAVGPGIDWAVWLPLLDAPSVAWNFTGDQSLIFYANGTGRLTGTIQNSANPSWQMTVDMYFENGRDWTEWSALGRSYKNDLGLAGTNYLNWVYYELKPVFSHISGIGLLEGSELSLQHLPSNFYFGFQSGVASNNKNANDGMSGWFSYSGTFNGDVVSGNGDVNVDRSCSTVEQECGATEYSYIYRAEDACGAVAFATRVITITDNVAPEFSGVEATLFVPCALADSTYATATDACSSVSISYTDEIVEAGCPGIINRTYTATDGCGNTAEVSQTIYLIDEGEPEFTVFPVNVQVSCEDEIDLNPLVQYSAVCFNTTLTQSDVITVGICSANYTLERTYTLTDGCGNSISRVWIVQVSDTQAPVISNVPASADLDCGDEVPSGNPTATDNCSEFEFISDVLTEDQACGYITTTTWTATDACGNSSSAIQVISFIDSADPEYSYIPESVTLSCGEEFVLDTAIVNDDCSPVTLAWTDEPLFDCAGSYIRIWRAFDGCGNQALESTTVTLVDNEAPVLIGIPAASEGACGSEPVAANVVASDNCDSDVTVVFTEVTIPGNCGNIVTYTWTATDNCGNSTSEERTYSLTDNVAPQFESVVDTVYASCGDDVSLLDIPLPVVTDACSEVISLESIDTEVPSVCGSVIVRNYTATDGCGNSSSAQQIIIFEDTAPPVFISAPENIIAACGADSGNNSLPVVEDNCSEVVITFEDQAVEGQGCTGSLIRHWVATDACGNASTYDQEISYADNSAPIILSFPEDQTAGCDQVPVADASAITFEDNCSSAVATVSDVLIPGGCSGGYNIERTYTVTDACGNSVSATQIIYVVDEVAPEMLGVPADTVIFCGDPLPAVSSTSAVDNCSGADEITLFVDEQVFPSGCGTTVLRVYMASDACGNTTSIVQEISVIDNVPPVFNEFDAEVELSCSNASVALATAFDDCSDVTVTYSDNLVEGSCGIRTRVYTAVDACGNMATAEQTLIVSDPVAPVFVSFPVSASISCDEVLPAEESYIEFIENCSEVTVAWSEEIIEGDCPNSYTTIRTCTLTDGCGNTVSQSYTLNISDTEGPQILGVPADLVLDCGEAVPNANVTVIDNCTAQPLISLSETMESIGCTMVLTRRWTAEDECGNLTQAVQVITYIDQTDPVLSEYPEPIYLTCGDPLPAAPSVTAEDNCSGAVEVTFTELGEAGTLCPIYERIWCAIDCSGNETCHTQVIYFDEPFAGLTPAQPQMSIWQSSSDRLNVQFTANESGRWGVDAFDLNGRRMSNLFVGDLTSGETRRMDVDAHEFVSGIYIIQFSNGTSTVTKRLPIVR
jgi:hypothetical protein